MSQLPIDSYIDQIVKSVNNHKVTIISAETGSGKSTRVPISLYENLNRLVVCTQPRRLACISLAKRVSSEYLTSHPATISDLIGYQTAFESSRTENTKVLYCTDGLALVKAKQVLLSARLSDIIFIIDEVHEWNINIEALLGLVNNMISKTNVAIKLVIMSATLDTTIFTDFFKENLSIIKVPSRQYKVTKHIDVKIDYYKLIADQLAQRKNVLAFQSGKKEIDSTIGIIRSLLNKRKLKVKILPLYSDMPYEDQQLVFQSYDIPKLVVATNIAQTSLTIPDMDVVVDNGQEKQLQVNNGIEGLFITEISKADCQQRAGRVGRTKDGEYYLCSKYPYKNRLDYPIPEIQRLNLDRVVLRLLSVGIDMSNLSMVHNPNQNLIKLSKQTLFRLGAIDTSNRLTNVGEIMLNIPVSVKSARSIAEALKYHPQVLEEVICISAILEYGGLLKTSAKSINKGYNHYGVVRVTYKDFSDEQFSDPMAELDIFKSYSKGKLPSTLKNAIMIGHFTKAQDYVKKLTQLIKASELISTSVLTNQSDEFSTNDSLVINKNYSRNDTRKCIAIGMIDTIYSRKSDNTVVDEDNKEYSISNYSVNYNGLSDYSIFVGLPRTVSYINNYGIKINRTMLTFSTSFKSVDELISD